MVINSSSIVLAGTIVADANAKVGIVVGQSSSAVVVGNFVVRGNPLAPASVQANGNGEHGIQVGTSSSLSVFSLYDENTIVRANNNKKYNGMAVENGSSLIMVGAHLEATGNKIAGLTVGGSSSAAFYGFANESRGVTGVFTGNGGDGVGVWGSSFFTVWDDGVAVNITAANNTGRGLTISGGSEVGFNSPASEPPSKLVFNENGQAGVGVYSNGSLYSILPSEMKNNGSHGVDAWGNAHVDMDAATITGNGNSGVSASHGATVDLYTAIVTGNTSHGIFVERGSSFFLGASQVANNGNHGLSIGHSTAAHIYDTNVTSNTGHGIAVYSNSALSLTQYFGQNLGRPVSDRAIVTKVLVIGAGPGYGPGLNAEKFAPADVG